MVNVTYVAYMDPVEIVDLPLKKKHGGFPVRKVSGCLADQATPARSHRNVCGSPELRQLRVRASFRSAGSWAIYCDDAMEILGDFGRFWGSQGNQWLTNG